MNFPTNYYKTFNALLNNDISKMLRTSFVSTLDSALPINGLDLEGLEKIEDKKDEYGNLLIKLCYTKHKAYKNRIMVVLNGQDIFFQDPDWDIMFYSFNAITSSIVDIEKSITKKKENLYNSEQYESESVRRFLGLYNIEKKETVKDENGNTVSIFYDFSENNDNSQMNYRIDEDDKYRKLIDKIENWVVIPWKDQDGRTEFYSHQVVDGYHFIKDDNASDWVKIILPWETQYHNNGQKFVNPELKWWCIYYWNTNESHKQRLWDIWSGMNKSEQDIFIKENKSVIVSWLDEHVSLADIIIEWYLNIIWNNSNYIVYLKDWQWNFHNIATSKSDLVLSDIDYNKNHILISTPLINERTAFCINNKNTNDYKLLYYSSKEQSYIFSNNPNETSRLIVVERVVSDFEGVDDLIRTATIYELHFLLDDNTEKIVKR